MAQRLDASGNVVSSDLYDAYGAKLAGNPNSDPYGYDGQWGYYTDSETGLVLCTHRYYDPANGRWVTRDPIGYDGGVNLYTCCDNDVTSRVDPNGTYGWNHASGPSGTGWCMDDTRTHEGGATVRYLRDRIVKVIAGLLVVATACVGAPSPVALRGDTIFTIPWGDGWGQLTFISEAEVGEGMYYGPTAMGVGPDGNIYVYDPVQRRLLSFLPGGRFDTGAEFGRGIDLATVVFGGSKPGARPLIFVADDRGFIAKLNKFGPKPGPASYTQVLKGAARDGMTFSRLGVATPGSNYVQVGGFMETPYIQCYDGDRYRRRFNATDLVALYPWYYGLALDRQGKDLYVNPEGQLVVQQIDGNEAQVLREIPLTLPQIGEKQARWHLIGAGAQGIDVVFFFAPHWPLPANDQIYAVSAKGNILGTAKAALPDGKDPGRYLKLWKHLAVVDYFGNLYLGIPTDKGLAIVRYRLPKAGQ